MYAEAMQYGQCIRVNDFVSPTTEYSTCHDFQCTFRLDNERRSHYNDSVCDGSVTGAAAEALMDSRS